MVEKAEKVKNVSFKQGPAYARLMQWMTAGGKNPFGFQETCWEAVYYGNHGLLNAPTGYGKTYAILLGALARAMDENLKASEGLRLLWITPLRALAKDLHRAIGELLPELLPGFTVGLRTGDTSDSEKKKQDKKMPDILVSTPESMQVLLSRKDHPELLGKLRWLVVDEWHELLGSKRGVQTELFLSRLAHLRRPADSPLCCWGISATLGNLEEAASVLLSPFPGKKELVRADVKKELDMFTIIPAEVESYPWAGHLGLKMLPPVMEVVESSRTSLLFTNTRSQAEIWYQAILEAYPEMAGLMALHHGAIDRDLRNWVEDSLHEGKLKLVVTTSSLDLGVDFRPVDTVIQIGSPKGVARFLQRAGRSGHQPGARSRIWFVPTHSLELAEAAALRTALEENHTEQREPVLLPFDVLLQYACTLACGTGFYADELFAELRSTHAFQDLHPEEFQQCLFLLTHGGESLRAYDEYKKMICEEGLYRLASPLLIKRHRMHIGTIVSDAAIKVKFLGGSFIGTVEEWFISRLNPGDVFTLAGKRLELHSVQGMEARVKLSKKKKSQVPAWMGGRISFSANLGNILRRQLMTEGPWEENRALEELLSIQKKHSALPAEDELLIEHLSDRDGHHLFIYPFEGRLVHEAMAGLLAWRLSRQTPLSFSMAMNDYGFELLCEQELPFETMDWKALFSLENLNAHLLQSINASEMAKRKFRDIAVISGMVFQGFPGREKANRHLQSSSSLLFKVFSEFEPENLLYRQAFRELLHDQFEEGRLRAALQRIGTGKILFKKSNQYTPLSFPLKVDSLRQSLSSEQLEDRIRKMKLKLIA